ncbi:hypothetical protein [Bacillus atrophaeus]|uniref:hypothetical protein n=1 Tax=Bacillus atrophaeus TaxID=1452 RepID=UPI003F59CF8B
MSLVHGEWIKLLEHINIHPRTAQQMMKVTKELGDLKTSTYSHYGLKALELISSLSEELGDTYHPNFGANALYLIATLPEPERIKPHQIPSTGELKTVDEMTVVRVLREVKKALKEIECTNCSVKYGLVICKFINGVTKRDFIAKYHFDILPNTNQVIINSPARVAFCDVRC